MLSHLLALASVHRYNCDETKCRLPINIGIVTHIDQDFSVTFYQFPSTPSKHTIAARNILRNELEPVVYFGKELFIRFTASAFRNLPSIYVFSHFPFGFEGRVWGLIVSVPGHCLSFYFTRIACWFSEM